PLALWRFHCGLSFVQGVIQSAPRLGVGLFGPGAPARKTGDTKAVARSRPMPQTCRSCFRVPSRARSFYSRNQLLQVCLDQPSDDACDEVTDEAQRPKFSSS